MTAGRRFSWVDLAIVLGAVALGVGLVRWADSEYVRVAGPPSGVKAIDEWQWRYRRGCHAWLWVAATWTLGVGAILARAGRFGNRRGLQRAGTRVVLVILVVGGATAAHFLLAAPRYLQTNGTSYGLYNALQLRVPGAILGAWVVGGVGSRRRVDWRERAGRLAGWLWIADVGLLVASGFCFG